MSPKHIYNGIHILNWEMCNTVVLFCVEINNTERFVPYFLNMKLHPQEFWPLNETKIPHQKKPWGGTWGSQSSVCLYLILLLVLSSIPLVAYNKKNFKCCLWDWNSNYLNQMRISVYYESLCPSQLLVGGIGHYDTWYFHANSSKA